jgi:hypothetical protein
VGAEVTVADAATVRISGAPVALPDGAAEAIWLSA